MAVRFAYKADLAFDRQLRPLRLKMALVTNFPRGTSRAALAAPCNGVMTDRGALWPWARKLPRAMALRGYRLRKASWADSCL